MPLPSKKCNDPTTSMQSCAFAADVALTQIQPTNNKVETNIRTVWGFKWALNAKKSLGGIPQNIQEEKKQEKEEPLLVQHINKEHSHTKFMQTPGLCFNFAFQTKLVFHKKLLSISSRSASILVFGSIALTVEGNLTRAHFHINQNPHSQVKQNSLLDLTSQKKWLYNVALTYIRIIGLCFS